MKAKDWPRTARAMRARLNEITPNLKEIGIVVDFKKDTHTKTDNITLVNIIITPEPRPFNRPKNRNSGRYLTR